MNVLVTKLRENSRWICKVCYIGVFFYLLLSFIVSKVNIHLSNIFFIVAFVLIIVLTISNSFCISEIMTSVALQSLSIGTLLTLFWGISLKCVIEKEGVYDKYIAYLGLVALLCYSIFWLLIVIKRFIVIKSKIRVYFQNNKYVFLIFVVFALCYIPCFMVLFKSDSNVYYTTICENIGKWDFTMGGLQYLQMGYHMSYGYSIFTFIGEGLISMWGIGIRLSNLLLFFITLICLNGVIRKIIPNRNNVFYALTLMVFSFNPLILGIIQELNLDYAIVCFFIWVVWAYLNEYKVYMIFFSGLLCLSKENAIVILAGFAMGLLVYRIKNIEKPISLMKVLKCIKKEEWMLIFIVLAVVANTVLLNNQWGKTEGISSEDTNIVNTVQFNGEYILIKLKQMFVLNFQWLAVLFIVISSIIIIARRRIVINEIGYALMFSFLTNMIFQLLFFTYPHYRYLQIDAFYYAVAVAYFLSQAFDKKKIISVSMSILVGAFFVQSFYYFDFISNMISKKVPTGNGELISEAYYSSRMDKGYILVSEKEGGELCNEKYRDYVQNNRQYLGFEICFERLLKDIGYDDNKAVILSPIFGDLDYTIVNMFGTSDKQKLKWNKKFSQITYDSRDMNINWIYVDNLSNEIKNYGEVWYIELPCENESPISKVYGYIDKDEKMVSKYMDWQISAYKLKK